MRIGNGIAREKLTSQKIRGASRDEKLLMMIRVSSSCNKT